jgi:broad-specificity NMP kinase
MSGLPGSGESRRASELYKSTGTPIVSMDILQKRMGISPDDDQGKVVQVALEELRGFQGKTISDLGCYITDG